VAFDQKIQSSGRFFRLTNCKPTHKVMDIIHIKATNSTPEIQYSEDGRLLIKGRSINEGGINFFQPLIDWAETLQIKILTVDINLEFVNSTSSKKLLILFKTLDTNKNIRKLLLNWYYAEGDEGSYQKGVAIQDLLHRTEFRFHKMNGPES
jgi:hypothetical protein